MRCAARVTIDDAAQITLIAASIISIVCEIMWRAARSSKRSTPTVGIAVSRALVKADREVELLGHRPERLVHRALIILLP